jgi:hypothetical protein
LVAWRLRSQKLSDGRRQRPAQVVECLGGVQAQDYQWAKWSIGMRTADCTDEDVERAIRNHEIVRTWMFRGTLHFVAANDLPWLRSLLAPGIIRRNARRYRQLRLDAATFARSQKVLQMTLEGNRPLTRAEIKEHFENEGIPAQGQQLPFLLQRAALDGLICYGPQRGSEPTYVLVSDWVGERPPLELAEVLQTLVVRYLESHGPATLRDFAWWAGLTVSEARPGVESVSEARTVEADGVQYWAIGEWPSGDATERACLLPRFDEWLLGYRERSLVLRSADMKRVSAGGGMPKPTVMVNGDIAGTWSHHVGSNVMLVSIQPFRSLLPQERDLIDGAATELGKFKRMSVEISYA